MIPAQDIEADVPSPLPEAGMPDPEEVSEEGFGGFRDAWYIGHVAKADMEAILREEVELMRIVDAVAATPEEFEELASAIEGCDLESLPEQLHEAAMREGLAACVDEEIAPLDGLELGVAGLAYPLGSVGCLTAASTFGRKQVGLNEKAPTCGSFAEPSDGLEPSTPSLPCAPKRLPWVAIGCRSAYLSRFRGLPICDRLPPVAPAWLHKRSIPLLRLLMGKGIPRARIGVAGVDHLPVERGSTGPGALS
jgi:hypothetical protein